MSKFMKVKVRQPVEGKPGFVEDEEFEVKINVNQITLYNKSFDDSEIVFVRMTCGASLTVVSKYQAFEKNLKKAVEQKG